MVLRPKLMVEDLITVRAVEKIWMIAGGCSGLFGRVHTRDHSQDLISSVVLACCFAGEFPSLCVRVCI